MLLRHCCCSCCFKGSGQHAKPPLHLSRNLCHLSCHVHHPCLQMDRVRKIIPPTSHLVPNVTVQVCISMLTSKTVEKSLLRWCRRPKSRKDGNRTEVDAKKEYVHELEPTLQRRAWLVNTLCSASRFSSGRTEPPQPRFSASRSRSTSFWPFARMTLDELKLLPKLDEMVV